LKRISVLASDGIEIMKKLNGLVGDLAGR